MTKENIELFMKEALREAMLAAAEEEIPIGCVVVRDGEIIARGRNSKETHKNSLFHAEINAMNAACGFVKEKYLTDCSVFVTLEPCAMCAGAMLNYRVKELYFGAFEPKSGCAGSLYNILEDGRFNHFVKVEGGVLEEECARLMKSFFAERRGKKC